MAVKIEEIFAQVGYEVSGGDEHGWQDLYPYSRFIDFAHNFSTVFSTKTGEVYQVEFWDENSDVMWTWVSPEKRADYQKKLKNMDPHIPEYQIEWATDIGTVIREYKVKRKEISPLQYNEIEGYPV